MNYEHLLYQTKPTCANGVVIDSTKSANSFLRVGTTLTRENRLYIQTVEGNIYSAPFYLDKTDANTVALAVMQEGYTDDGSEAATMEARAMELLRQAQNKRAEEKQRLEKMDVEVAEYRKTELMGSEVTARNFVEWDSIQEDAKQDWRNRYAAVFKLFKNKFNVGDPVLDAWEPVKFDDLRVGDAVRVRVGSFEKFEYRTILSRRDSDHWQTDSHDISGHVDYTVLERKVE